MFFCVQHEVIPKVNLDNDYIPTTCRLRNIYAEIIKLITGELLFYLPVLFVCFVSFIG